MSPTQGTCIKRTAARALLLLALLSTAAGAEYLDLSVGIPPGLETIKPGGSVVVQVRLMQFASTGRNDILVGYAVKNPSGQAIADKSETIAVETQASIVRQFEMPKNAAAGTYRIEVTAASAGGSPVLATQSFTVEDENPYSGWTVPAGAIAALALAGGAYVMLARNRARKATGKS